MTPNKPSNDALRTTRNSLVIIEAIRRLDEASITDIAEEVDMAKSSVHDHLTTLRNHKYVIKRDNAFYLSFKFLDHGVHARERKNNYKKVGEKVQELAENTGEKVQFVIEEFGQGVFLLKSTGEKGVQAHTRIGSRVDLHSTASGKAILAHLPTERVDEIIAYRGLPPKTSSTVTEQEELRSELSTIRERGFAFNEGENIRGVWSVGAPVKKDEDSLLGAISLSTPMNRVHDDDIREELTNTLLESINELELNIAYS